MKNRLVFLLIFIILLSGCSSSSVKQVTDAIIAEFEDRYRKAVVSVNYPLTENSSLIEDKLKTDILLNNLHEARRLLYETLRSKNMLDIESKFDDAKTALKELTDHLRLIRAKARKVKLMESILL